MKKEIKSILKSQHHGDIPYTYRDLDHTDEIKDKKVNSVHGYCFWQNKLVIVKNVKNGEWTPAGGGVEKGESIEEAVDREVHEESNMKVLDQRIIGCQEIFLPDKTIVQTRSVCIVEPYGPFISDPDGDITEIKLIDPKDYKKYFDWGEIGDHIMERTLKMLKEFK